MKECRINGKLVPYEKVCTHWSIWNKSEYNESKYTIHISFDEIVVVFKSYWADVMERESDPELDDGFPLTEIEIDLKEANYPPLNVMLKEYPDLLCRYILSNLQTEFIGFVVNGSDGPHPASLYKLSSIEYLRIDEGIVYIEGLAGKLS